MSILISKGLSRDKKKYWYFLEWGKQSGERVSAKPFTYVEPINQIQKNHNKEALAIFESKKSKLVLEVQSSGTSYVPAHRMRYDFLEIYKEFAEHNSKPVIIISPVAMSLFKNVSAKKIFQVLKSMLLCVRNSDNIYWKIFAAKPLPITFQDLKK